jgi:hypothetical protein
VRKFNFTLQFYNSALLQRFQNPVQGRRPQDLRPK